MNSAERHVVSVESLICEPYAAILCYPNPTTTEINRRLKQLRGLGVTAFEFAGEKRVMNLSVLGKGCVGLVVLALQNQAKVALKIRRVDADRAEMQREAGLLKKANSVNVGPRFLRDSKDIIAMQFVDGVLLSAWLRRRRSKAKVKGLLRDILEQCWRLDESHLDHGELSHAPKHLIVNKKGKPVIVDFESASLDRRVANITSVCQFLFLSGETARLVERRLGNINRKAILETLKHYKHRKNCCNFGRVLEACGLFKQYSSVR